MDLADEFDRQLSNLLDKKYPKLAGLSEAEFRKLLEPLKSSLPSEGSDVDFGEGTLPFVIVISSNLVPAKEQMEAVVWNERPGFEKLFPHQADEFKTIESLDLPETQAYLLIDIDRGKEYLNITPESALQSITNNGRTPLTMEEGIAVVTEFPEFLIKNNCFSLLGSRVSGNQRVPAIWINANKQANLGWCWDRNPHTWLGSASARERLG